MTLQTSSSDNGEGDVDPTEGLPGKLIALYHEFANGRTVWGDDLELISEAALRLQAAETKVERLVEVVRPFARVWEQLSEDDRVRRAWIAEMRFPIDAIRKARSLLSEVEGEGKQGLSSSRSQPLADAGPNSPRSHDAPFSDGGGEP